MNKSSSTYYLKSRHVIKILILSAIIFTSFSVSSFAATIIMNTGAAIKGKIIEEKEDSIMVQITATKQVIKIKLDTIREIMLDPDEKKLADKNKKLKLMKEETDIVGIIQPTIGFLPGAYYTLGKLATRVKLGYGGALFFDLGLPLRNTGFGIRLGLTAGFWYNTVNNLGLVPGSLHARFLYHFSSGVRPYIKVAGGMTYVMSRKGSSIDPTFTGSLGLAFIPNSIPYIEFFIEAGFMMVFETVRGDFLTASVGFAYRFGAPKPAK